MAINTEIRRAGVYRGDGQQRDFPFNFKVFEKDDLVVLVSTDSGVTERQLGTSDFDVSINADQEAMAGGTVRLSAPLAVGSTMAILSGVDYLQTMVLTNRGGFFPTVINDAFDKTTAQIQQIREMVGRAVKAPATSTLTSEQFTAELFNARDSAVSASETAQSASIEAGRQATVASGARDSAEQSVREAQAQAELSKASANQAKASESAARGIEGRVSTLIPQLEAADQRLEEHERSFQRKLDETNATIGEREAMMRESVALAFAAKEEAEVARDTANASVELAKQAEIKAKESEAQAKASALSANTSAQTATTSATQALSAASQVTDDRERIAQLANTVASSVVEAQAAATTAEAFATKAKASETTAKASETSAKSAEKNAKTVSQQASASASSAKKSAEQATAAATTASTARDTALVYAQRAESASTAATQGQIQANWEETRSDSKAYIQNKPTAEIEYVKGLRQNPPVFPADLEPYQRKAEATATYLTQESARALYATKETLVEGLTGKVSVADYATAIKDLQDKDKAVDTALATLATKTEVATKVDKVWLDKEHEAFALMIMDLRREDATIRDSLEEYARHADLWSYVPRTGDRGVLKGYSRDEGGTQNGGAVTIDINSPDDLRMNISGNVTFNIVKAPVELVATKVIHLWTTDTATVTWNNVNWGGGSSPKYGTKNRPLVVVIRFSGGSSYASVFFNGD